jgi:uncharacterized protein YbjT (DUF2867 family)
VTRKTLAITGGTGLVGSALIRRAVADGWQVRALTRRQAAPKDGVTWIDGALDQPDSLMTLVDGSDAVIHVAGIVKASNKAAFEAGNVGGTRAIVEAATKANVGRFVHVSSLAAREPRLSDYGASKAKAEHIVQASGLDWTIIRPPAIFGPDDTDHLDLFKMARSGWMLMPPNGRLSVIEVSDLARALLAVVDHAPSIGAVYEVDDGLEGGWPHEDWAKAIGWAMNKKITTLSMPAPLVNLAARLDQLVRRDGAKLTADRASYFCHPDWVIDPARRPPSDLWLPQIATRAGLKQTATAYRNKGWL